MKDHLSREALFDAIGAAADEEDLRAALYPHKKATVLRRVALIAAAAALCALTVIGTVGILHRTRTPTPVEPTSVNTAEPVSGNTSDSGVIYQGYADRSLTLQKDAKRDNFAEIRPLIGISALPEEEQEALWKKVEITTPTGSKFTAESKKGLLLPMLEALEGARLPAFPENTNVRLANITAWYEEYTTDLNCVELIYSITGSGLGLFRVFLPISEDYQTGFPAEISDETLYDGELFRIATFRDPDKYKNYAYSNPVELRIPGERCVMHLGARYDLDYHIRLLEQMTFVPLSELLYGE